MTEYNPDSWVVLKMTHKDEIIYKVLGGWSGDYLHGDAWRLNSGIEKCEYDIANDRYRFYGSSGSVYNVNPESYGLRIATANILQTMQERFPNQVEMLENRDWSQFKFVGNN